MLQFTFGDPTTFCLTLSETETVGNGSYLFVFTRVVPGRVIAVNLSPETSDDRVETFAMDVDAVFAGCEPGQYYFDVYEQEDTSNLDPALADNLLESGTMTLYPATPFAFTVREIETTFTQPA